MREVRLHTPAYLADAWVTPRWVSAEAWRTADEPEFYMRDDGPGWPQDARWRVSNTVMSRQLEEGWVTDSTAAATWSRHALGFGVVQGDLSPPTVRPSYREAFVPTWSAVAALLAPLAVLTAGRVRRGRWVAVGLCASCGYDLTGNVSGRCPECGRMSAAQGVA